MRHTLESNESPLLSLYNIVKQEIHLDFCAQINIDEEFFCLHDFISGGWKLTTNAETDDSLCRWDDRMRFLDHGLSELLLLYCATNSNCVWRTSSGQ